MATQTIDLGYRPRPWQRECHLRKERFGCVVVHRRGGKTHYAIMELVDSALRATSKLPRFGYIAPFLNQAKTIAWDILVAYTAAIPGIRKNEAELWVELPHNGARIRLFGADHADRLRGLYFDGVVLDEVAQIDQEVWSVVVMPALLDRKGWARAIGTPKGINLFSEMYYRGLRETDWFSVSYDVTKTGALSEEEIALARTEARSETNFRQEFMCDFTAAAVDALIPVDAIEEASGKHYRVEQYDVAARVLGVDVARFGDDRTVIFPRQGLAAFEPIILQGQDTMAVAAAVLGAQARFQADAIFVDDTGGFGAGVIDRLRQLGHDPIGVNFGAKASQSRYLNKRVEMWWEMRDWIVVQGGAIPDIPGLKVELGAPTYWEDSAGRLVLEPKDKIKERMGYSPDLADALALTFAYPVSPSMVQAANRRSHGANYNARA